MIWQFLLLWLVVSVLSALVLGRFFWACKQGEKA